MQMPTAGVGARQLRLAHERRMKPEASAYLLDCSAKQDHRIGAVDAIDRIKAHFDLTWSPFIFERANRKAEIVHRSQQCLQHIVDLVAMIFQQILKSMRCRSYDRRRRWISRSAKLLPAQHVVDHTRQVPLDFETRNVGEARSPGLAQGVAENSSSVEGKWLTIRKEHLANDPAGFGSPGQNGEGRRIRHQHAIRIASHLLHAEAAAFDERIEDNRVGGIKDPWGHRKIDPVRECLRKEPGGQCFAADDSVLIGYGEANRGQLFCRGALDGLLRGVTLSVTPQTVFVDESLTSNTQPRWFVGHFWSASSNSVSVYGCSDDERHIAQRHVCLNQVNLFSDYTQVARFGELCYCVPRNSARHSRTNRG